MACYVLSVRRGSNLDEAVGATYSSPRPYSVRFLRVCKFQDFVEHREHLPCLFTASTPQSDYMPSAEGIPHEILTSVTIVPLRAYVPHGFNAALAGLLGSRCV